MRTLVLALAVTAAACQTGSSGGESVELTDTEWCMTRVFDEGLAPTGWDEVTLVEDCTQALKAGWSRSVLRDVYADLKAGE